MQCWRTLFRNPWTERRSNQSILKEISPEYSLEGLMLKLKLNTLATWFKELTDWKRPWCLERLKAGGEGFEDEMVRWHHRLNGLEFEQSPKVDDGQGDLACCSPWGCKESDMTEWLNWIYIRGILALWIQLGSENRKPHLEIRDREKNKMEYPCPLPALLWDHLGVSVFLDEGHGSSEGVTEYRVLSSRIQ